MSTTTVLGGYELLDRIAEGGMAEVWRAKARGAAGFEKIVVIKRVLPALMANPAFADLLVREAKIAARLSHPRIAQIFDLGEEEGSYFIAMEYVHGRSLDHAIAYRGSGDNGGLSLSLRLWIIAEAASALDHAHRRKSESGRPLQIVHRDVSPQNILLSYDGDVKVADFGIARADEQGLGKGEDPRVLRGKFAYMSPEQARGEPLDHRSDVFSLGVVLYELVSGVRLFRGRNSQDTLAMVRAARPTRIDPAALGIDSALALILETALQPEREERYRSAGALHADLTSYLFRRGEVVGPHSLAEAMERMFPADDALAPNKLRVDLLIRAYQDATAVSAAGAIAARVPLEDEDANKTAPQPLARRSTDERAVCLLGAAAREGEGNAFGRAVQSASGVSFGVVGDYRVAAFGHLASSEQAASQAGRAALDFRRIVRTEGPVRTSAVPGIGIWRTNLRIVNGSPRPPDDEEIQRAREWIDALEPGAIAISRELTNGLDGFRLRFEGELAQISGYRKPSDRYIRAVESGIPLLGRDTPLAELVESIVHCMRGGARRIELVGEPGIGKTRLLSELQTVAQLVSQRAREMQVEPTAITTVQFVCARVDQAGERNFGPFVDMFCDLCGIEPDDLPEERFPKVEQLRRFGLAEREVHLVGELLGLAYPSAPVSRMNRPRGLDLVMALRRGLTALARDRVVVVVVENLQWLDDSTRQLLPFLLVGLAKPRVLTILSRRPGVVVPPLDADPIVLRPLDEPAARRLFSNVVSRSARSIPPEVELDAELSRVVREQCAGEPGAIEALATELTARHALDAATGTLRVKTFLPDTIPEDYARSVVARLAQLRDDDRALLTAMALLEGDAAPALVYAIQSVVPSDGLAALHRLIASGFVRAWDEEGAAIAGEATRIGKWGGGQKPLTRPGRVRVAHELLRAAICSRLEALARRRFHERIAATIERLAGLSTREKTQRLAHHYAAADDGERGPAAQERAAEMLVAEGDREGAARHLERALRVMRTGMVRTVDAASEREIELALRAARLWLASGNPENAGRVLDSVACSRDERALELTILRAECALLADCPDHAVGLLSEHEPLLPRAPARLHAASRVILGRALFEASRLEDALYALGDAADVARGSREGLLLGHARALQAQVYARADRLRDADDAAQEALALAARTGDVGLRYAALTAQATVEDANGNCEAASIRYREAYELAAHEGLSAEVRTALVRAAVSALRAADPSAECAVRDAWERLSGSQSERLLLLCQALRCCCDTDVECAERAIEQLEVMGWNADAAVASDALARCCHRAGNVGQVGRLRARARELAEHAGWTSLAREIREAGEQEMRVTGVEPV